MNVKQILGIVAIAIGVCLFYYGFYSRAHLSGARSEVYKMTQSKNPIVKAASKDLEKKFGKLSAKVKWEFAGGTFFVLGGAAVLFWGYNKKKKHR